MRSPVKRVSCVIGPLCEKQTYDNVLTGAYDPSEAGLRAPGINHTLLNRVRRLIGPKYSRTDVDQ